MRPALPVLVLTALALAGCPSAPTLGGDAGRDASSPIDAHALDVLETNDVGMPPDSPSGPDVGTERDATMLPDAWRDACPEGLGAFCEDAPCPTGYECMVGRCAPQGRQLCGGFAGARCTEPDYTACTYFSSADFGPCLTPEEQRCICDDPARAAGFACP